MPGPSQKNYYEILELPLSPLLAEPSAVLPIIDEKVREWNRLIAGPKGTLYKHYRELAPEMRRTLGERTQLRQQAQEARARMLGKIRSFATWAGKPQGCISPQVFASLAKQYPLLSEKDIADTLRRVGVSIAMPASTTGDPGFPPPIAQRAAPGQPSPQKLDETLLLLRVLDKESAYELLGCEPDDSLLAVQAGLAAFKAKVSRMPAGKSNKDASNRLCMLMAEFFANHEARHGFDAGWELHLATRQPLTDIGILLAGPAPCFLWEHYGHLVAELEKGGLSHAEAAWFVYDECCNKRKAAFPAPQPRSRTLPASPEASATPAPPHVPGRRLNGNTPPLLLLWGLAVIILIICLVVKYKQLEEAERQQHYGAPVHGTTGSPRLRPIH